jgi:hypothetical protein
MALRQVILCSAKIMWGLVVIIILTAVVLRSILRERFEDDKDRSALMVAMSAATTID